MMKATSILEMLLPTYLLSVFFGVPLSICIIPLLYTKRIWTFGENKKYFCWKM